MNTEEKSPKDPIALLKKIDPKLSAIADNCWRFQRPTLEKPADSIIIRDGDLNGDGAPAILPESAAEMAYNVEAIIRRQPSNLEENPKPLGAVRDDGSLDLFPQDDLHPETPEEKTFVGTTTYG